MSGQKLTLGQAIDKIIEALETLNPSERETAINAACTHLEVKIVGGQKASLFDTTSDPQPPNNPAAGGIKQMDIRTLKEQKSPKTAAQMACLVAYYLQEFAPSTERKETVSAGDLTKYFKQASFPLPARITQLLPDCRAAGYFDSATGKGEYSLNAVGYNLVAHTLPMRAKK